MSLFITRNKYAKKLTETAEFLLYLYRYEIEMCFLSLLLQRIFNITVSTQILLLYYPLWCPGLQRLQRFNFYTWASEVKTDEFTNSIDEDEEAQNEPPHRHLRSLPSSLSNFKWYCMDDYTFLDISWKHFLEDMHLEILALTPNLVGAR